jgi:hypothetical protein
MSEWLEIVVVGFITAISMGIGGVIAIVSWELVAEAMSRWRRK